MQTEKYPFAVRLLGFPPEEARAIALGLHRAPRKGAAYFCLSDGSLQEPDLYLANGADLRALAALDSLAGDIHPALVLGAPPVCLPYPSLRLPVRWGSVYSALDELLKRRAGALDKLARQGAPQRPDRRRRERLDLDLTEVADYAAMRHHAHRGAVLVLDRSPAFSLHVGRLLLAWRRACRWADNEDEVVAICRQGEVALVLINTATPGIDPYRVCAAPRCASPTACMACVAATVRNVHRRPWSFWRPRPLSMMPSAPAPPGPRACSTSRWPTTTCSNCCGANSICLRCCIESIRGVYTLSPPF
ncbi:response regulator [Massilia sp. erpn]|uniref:response regulator n=1 Tax=Massilia sp. erpn TaxID=2738142 RepID=UPI00210594EB|nr:response regulator [Massilia sp. erpn]UTY57854.1 response regulator [Massilia sp. erpn]